MTGHGGNIYEKSKLYGIAPHEILDFSANINPLELNAKGKEVLLRSVDQIVHYPDPYCTELYETVSSVYEMEKEFILFGNGAAELIFAVCRLPHLKRALLVAPTFSEYAAGAKVAGLSTHSFPLRQEGMHFYIDWDSILQEMRIGDVLFLGNPNNPDGSLLTPDEIEKVLMKMPKGSMLVIDESFIDFVKGNHSCRELVKTYDSLIVLHSFTKYLAIPGLRLGALYAPTLYREQIASQIPTWSVNQLAQEFGKVALLDKKYREDTLALVEKEKAFMFNKISAIEGLFPVEPSVNFMLIHLDSIKWSLPWLEEELAKEGILIRNATNYEGLEGSWIRVAILTHEDNVKLTSVLQRLSEES